MSKKVRVRIQCNWHKNGHATRARVVGAFWVHPHWHCNPPARTGEDRWTVTHARSGRAIGQNYRDEARAVAVARELMCLSVKWEDVADQAAADALPLKVKRAVNAIHRKATGYALLNLRWSDTA